MTSARVRKDRIGPVILGAILFLASCTPSETEPPSPDFDEPGTTTTTQGETRVLSSTAVPPIRYPDDSGVVDVKKRYGAAGDGVTDDTSVLQRAVRENVGKNRILYFPPGTYLIRQPLEWKDEKGKWQPYLTLQGAGRDHTVIRLHDASPGFGDAATPRGVIVTASGLFTGDPTGGGKDYSGKGEGNEAFRNYLFDLTVHTGSRNPGAIGVDFLGNNNAGLVDVTIRSGDRAGVAGLSMTRKWPGPALVKDVTIEGFDVGVDVRWTEYGLTFENLTVVNQKRVGIRNRGNVLAIHGLKSVNGVPAVENAEGFGLVAVVDADLTGGAPGNSAIVNQGSLYLRSITAKGYRSALLGTSGLRIQETTAGGGSAPVSARSNPLRLRIEETPDVEWAGPDDWANVKDPSFARGADPGDDKDDTAAIQAALDSGRSTVYLPAQGGGRYIVSDTLTVPATVRRIIGDHTHVAPSPSFVARDGRPLFRFSSGAQPVVVERLVVAFNGDTRFPVGFHHTSRRPLVLRHVNVGSSVGVATGRGAGSLFLENYCCASVELGRGGRAWARQLNLEGHGLKLSNGGSDLWVLGLKTERASTAIHTGPAGRTEVIGGLLYPVEHVASDIPAFSAQGSGTHSLTYAVSAYGDQSRNYAIQVQEDNGSTVDRLMTSDVRPRGFGSVVPLHRQG